jgi:RNA polymerase sigma-70 factor (ECF subfamily)
MPNDDDSLMERIQGGDEDAFEELAGRYQEPLRRHLLAMVRGDDAAGDLLQEALLRAWTRAEQWDGRGGVRAWLFRIATNLALNHLRSVRRRRETPLEPPPAAPVDGEEREAETPAWMIDTANEAPDQAVIRAESVRRLHGLVDELPEEKREVWSLVYEQDLDMAGAAERLGIPTGTVKSRLHHARRQLAREWNEIEKEWESR